MASNFGFAGGIRERTVRPIWDAVDSPNSPHALVFCGNRGGKLLSLAEALLKRHITSHSLHKPKALIIYISVLEPS